jgi:hypothetical protein
MANFPLEKISVEEKFDPAKITFYYWTFLFRQAAELGGIWSEYEGPPPAPRTTNEKEKLMQVSKLAYAVLIRNCAMNIAQTLMPFANSDYPARGAWAHLKDEHMNSDMGARLSLHDQLSTLRMLEGERAGDYINRAVAIRAMIGMTGEPVKDGIFSLQLLRGLTADWSDIPKEFRKRRDAVHPQEVFASLNQEQRQRDYDAIAESRQRAEEKAFLARVTEKG